MESRVGADRHPRAPVHSRDRKYIGCGRPDCGAGGWSANDIAKVASWLESQGLKVNNIARGRHWITFSGTAESVGRGCHAHPRHGGVSNHLRHRETAAAAAPGKRDGRRSPRPGCVCRNSQGTGGSLRSTSRFRRTLRSVRSPSSSLSVASRARR
ncbi:MAG: hypothetical protein LAQ69_12570 [Acidobacteriia bacterium]|nr:hypothetical protein [Terriglobia bacterium]